MISVSKNERIEDSNSPTSLDSLVSELSLLYPTRNSEGTKELFLEVLQCHQAWLGSKCTSCLSSSCGCALWNCHSEQISSVYCLGSNLLLSRP